MYTQNKNKNTINRSRSRSTKLKHKQLKKNNSLISLKYFNRLDKILKTKKERENTHQLQQQQN